MPAITGPQVTSGKPTRRAGPPAARAPEAARQQNNSSLWKQLRGVTKPRIRTRGLRLVRDAPAATCLRRKKARLPGIICRRLQITADLAASLNRPTSRPSRTRTAVLLRRCAIAHRWTPCTATTMRHMMASVSNTKAMAGGSDNGPLSLPRAARSCTGPQRHDLAGSRAGHRWVAGGPRSWKMWVRAGRS